MKWGLAAAEQGYPLAQNYVGWRYIQGPPKGQDYGKAAQWFRRAAEQGDPEAQYNLGVVYSRGIGLEQSSTQAMAWFGKAAEQGYAPALALTKKPSE